MDVWVALKKAIKESGLSYQQISNRLNKSNNYMSATFAMKRSPSVKTLATISHAIGWHVELVSDDGSQRFTVE